MTPTTHAKRPSAEYYRRKLIEKQKDWNGRQIEVKQKSDVKPLNIILKGKSDV